MKHPIYIIVAMDEKRGIGKNGALPWKLKKEMKYFADTTTKTEDPHKQNLVIMGRTTWESLPEAYRPLPRRKNVVLTHNEDYQADGATVVHSIEEAIDQADSNIESIFILGGAKVFQEMINDPVLDGLYITHIHSVFHCDVFFPQIPQSFSNHQQIGEEMEGDLSYKYLLYKR